MIQNCNTHAEANPTKIRQRMEDSEVVSLPVAFAALPHTMTRPNVEPSWKIWLDRLLMMNVLVVVFGAGFLATAVLVQSQGQDNVMDLFQKLWQPLFTPALSLLIMSACLSGTFRWLQQRVLKSGSSGGS
ncbi:hypothetical protein [Synechococcus sp. M16CYN]|uniref:hypothetical protein n=1 Tax=Synechococcus sp. M16CYN TaxID=3103139 RepID=UPI0033421D73